MKSLNQYLFEGNIEFPEEIKKLNNRSSAIEIDNAISSVLNLGDDGPANYKKIDEFQKDFEKSTRRNTKYLSKTAVIEKIKEQFKKNIKDAEEKKKLEEHNKYLATPEGKQRKAEFDKKLEEINKEQQSVIDNILESIKNEIKSAGADVEKLYTNNFNYFTVKLKNNKELEFSFDTDWYIKKPTYKVSTVSFGYIEPESEETELIKLEYILLCNKTVIENIKKFITDAKKTQVKNRNELNNIRKEYKDLFLNIDAELD